MDATVYHPPMNDASPSPARRSKRRYSPAVIENILVPVDFSAASGNALEYAVVLAGRLNASVILLHCIEKLHSGSLLEQRKFLKLHHEVAEKARSELGRVFREKVEPVVPGHFHVKEGAPAEVIVDLAHKTRSQLIVMGTHGRTGMKHMLLGSVAEKVVRLSDCPVLTIKQ